MLAQNRRLGHNPMPQIDLPQTFSTQKDNASPAVTGVQFDYSKLDHQPVERKGLVNRLVAIHLSQSEWTNIAFVVVTFVGGLFCALYFFNSTEFFRAANAWHREFLYPRPRAAVQQAKIDRLGPREDQTLPLTENYRSSSEPEDNPFGRNVGSLNPNQSLATKSRGPNMAGSPSTPSTPSQPSPSSLLNQLNLPPPGGDTLLQAFNRGVADVGRASSVDGRRTVVVQGVGSQAGQKGVRAAKKNATSRAHTTLGNARGQRSIQTAQKSSQTAAAQTAAAVRSTSTNTSRQTVGTLRDMTSRSMSGLGSVRAPVSVGGRH
jgi:hypothetical protein